MNFNLDTNTCLLICISSNSDVVTRARLVRYFFNDCLSASKESECHWPLIRMRFGQAYNILDTCPVIYLIFEKQEETEFYIAIPI